MGKSYIYIIVSVPITAVQKTNSVRNKSTARFQAEPNSQKHQKESVPGACAPVVDRYRIFFSWPMANGSLKNSEADGRYAQPICCCCFFAGNTNDTFRQLEKLELKMLKLSIENVLIKVFQNKTF